MPKRIDCNECKGKGYITLTRMFNDYCGIGSKPCEACGGKGYFEVPMTNADRIRAMSDEELAKFVAEKIVSIENHKMVEQGHTPTATQLSALGHTMYCTLMRWLREPAEGE